MKKVCQGVGCLVMEVRQTYKNIERKKLPLSSQLELYRKSIILRRELEETEKGHKLRGGGELCPFVLNLDDWLGDFSSQVRSPVKHL